MIKSRYFTLVLLIGNACSQASYAEILDKTDEQRFKQAQSVDMGGVRFYPMLTTAVSYNDNIYETQDDERSSMMTRVAPQLNFVAPGDQHQLDFGLELEDVRYQDFSDDNYTDNNAYIALQAQPGLRHKFSILFKNMVKHATRGTDLSEGFDPGTNTIADNETIIDAPIEFTDKLTNLRYSFGVPGADGNIRLEAIKLDRQYDNFERLTRYFDRTELGGNLTFLWRVLPATAVAIEGRTNRIEYPNPNPDMVALDSRENTLLTGLEWDATERLSGKFRIGRKQKDFDSPEVPDATQNIIEFNGILKPDELSTFELSAERNPRETVGAGAFIDAESISASWEHKWLTRIESKIEVRGERLEYANVSRADGIRGLNLGVGYEMRRWLILRMEADLRQKTSDEAAYEYTQNQYWLSADLTL